MSKARTHLAALAREEGQPENRAESEPSLSEGPQAEVTLEVSASYPRELPRASVGAARPVGRDLLVNPAPEIIGGR